MAQAGWDNNSRTASDTVIKTNRNPYADYVAMLHYQLMGGMRSFNI
jgi:hypothetical protein